MKAIKDISMLTHYLQKYHITDVIGEKAMPYLHLFQFKKGDYITQEASPIDYLFLFVEGKAKVFTSLSNGKSSLLSFYTPLRIIGDLEFINYTHASATIECTEDSYCIGVLLCHAKAYLGDDAKFLKFIATSLGDKLARISLNSTINQLCPLETRLASYIIAVTLDHTFTDSIFEDNLIQVSELLGTSYRHLLRTLNTLCKKGVIGKVNQSYKVLDSDLLKQLSADLYV